MVATQSVNRKIFFSNDVLVVLDIIDEALKTRLVEEGLCVDNKECQLRFMEARLYTFLKINIYYYASKVQSFITRQLNLIMVLNIQKLKH